MESVYVNKEDLLTTLQRNKKNHLSTFNRAQEVYRKMAIRELEQSIKEAQEGKKIRRWVQLPEPENHIDDYNVVIGMLEMCVDETVELSFYDYQRYVLDQWGWNETFTANTVSYIAPKKGKK